MINDINHTRKLILVRHGKSDWDNNLSDRERPILPRAHKDAELVATEFKKHFSEPIYLVSSVAKRAKQTAQIFENELGEQATTFLLNENLYTFDVLELVTFIRKLPDQWQNVMIFGHNPAFTSVHQFLSDKRIGHIPTTGLVYLEFENLDTWKNAKYGKNKLELYAKQLR